MLECPICRLDADLQPVGGDYREWKCVRCGNFNIAESAEQLLENRRPHIDPKKLSEIVRARPRGAQGRLRINVPELDEMLLEARSLA